MTREKQPISLHTIGRPIERLLEAMRESAPNDDVDETTILDQYPTVLKSPDAAAAIEVVASLLKHNLLRRFHVRLDMDSVQPFLDNFSQDEIARRFEAIEAWVSVHHKSNHDGTILTPPLLEFLSRKAALQSLTDELDRLREETRNGRFRMDNVLQRDLEFRRFAHEKTWQLEPESYVLRGRYPPPLSTEELYGQFVELDELPAQTAKDYELNGVQTREVARAAYECVCFLRFLQEFKAKTSRDIVVIGNDRYGRQWNVEPIKDYLGDGFILRYDRVRSGTSMRLTVPSPFPDVFANELSRNMPHVVIVDGSHAPPTPDSMQISRAVRSYAHWFAVFNDVRAQGDVSRYRDQMVFPGNHLDELMRWHEYVSVRQQLSECVTPGPTYSVATWAPELRDHVIIGDVRVPREQTDFAGDRPLVVLSNAIFYRTEGDDLPQALHGTTPRYFDDPEHHENAEVVFGFGPYGLETRLGGTTTERFVATVQRHIKAEIGRLLEEDQKAAI